jgi:hypothetical protein
MVADDLIVYLFDGQSHMLAQPTATWLASSRRFVAFVTTFRDKIRKKLRTTLDQESLLDLLLELETAYLLLQERSLSVAYEPEQSGGIRNPDFAVTFTTSLTFMLEVTRLRIDPRKTKTETDGPAYNERLADAICSKLGQLLPQRSNVLLVGMELTQQTDSDLRATLLHLQQRAEGNDPSLLGRYRFRDRADFFRHYQRLSEVLVRGTQARANESPVVWVNPQAKYPLPSKVRTALYRSQTK